MSTNGIVFFSLYGFTLFVCLLTYWRARRGGPRARRLVRIGLTLSAVTLTVYCLSRRWEFGYAGDKTRVHCIDGMLCFDVVNETASQDWLRRVKWRATGWYWTDNSVVRIFPWRLLPVVRSRPEPTDSLGLPLLWMFFTAMIPACLAWLKSFRQGPPGCCSKCRYDLTGNVSGICPECGEPILSDLDNRLP